MSKQPQGPVADEIEKQIAKDVDDRKRDTTIAASEKAKRTVENDAGTSIPPFTRK
jgi:hypothetical protein